MKIRNLAYAAVAMCAVGAGSASAQRVVLDQNGVTSVGSFVEMWQQRINNENLPVAEPKTWGIRNLPRIAAFSADRFEIAQQVTSLGELEAMLVSAPISNGTSLEMLKATKPGNIALAVQPKLDPGTSPATYSDLLFTMVNPCRLMDTRVSQGGVGPLLNGIPRSVKIGPYSSGVGGYATGAGAQGGSATGCGLDVGASGNQVAAVMLAVSTVSQTSVGYLTFYSASTPDPSLSVVSMWYQPGYVQTSFIVMPTDSNVPSWGSVTSRVANTEVIADIVGYFAKAHVAALDCLTVPGTDTVLAASSSATNAIASACNAGYTLVANYCRTSSFGSRVSGWNDSSGGFCNFTNSTAFAITIANDARCCRVLGRP